MKMKLSMALVLATVLSGNTASPEATHNTLDSNTAFYEGLTLNYVIGPPDDFRMVTDEALGNGYSFAFIPYGEKYDSASIVIGANIFKVQDNSNGRPTIDELIAGDTAGIRQHFGKDIVISEVDPVTATGGYILRTFYVNDTTRFVPNVMTSYFDGGSEILIFDLSISETFPRFLAEKVYIECLEQFRVLIKGKLGVTGKE